MSHHCRAGKSHWTTQFRDHEAVLRMSLGARLIHVMTAKHLLNLVQGLVAFVARLPLPEKNEALAAYATLNLGIPARALAKDLHSSLYFSPGSSHPHG
jgi:hypothetical protein